MKAVARDLHQRLRHAFGPALNVPPDDIERLGRCYADHLGQDGLRMLDWALRGFGLVAQYQREWSPEQMPVLWGFLRRAFDYAACLDNAPQEVREQIEQLESLRDKQKGCDAIRDINRKIVAVARKGATNGNCTKLEQSVK